MANTIFSQSTPSGTDVRSEGDDRIRELKTALRSALDLGKYIPADLVIQNNAATPNSKVDVTASGLLVSDGANVSYMLDSVSVTADITASGANGLDTGVEAGTTWYSVWVIYNSTGNTIAALLSLSATAPTMPASYSYKRRVGWVRNNASSNFVPFVQRERFVLYGEVENEQRALSAGQSTTFADVVLTSFLPTTSRKAYLLVASITTHNAAGINFAGQIRGKGAVSTTDGVTAVRANSQVAAVEMSVQAFVWTETDSSQTIQYKIANVPATSGGIYVDVMGYEDPV